MRKDKRRQKINIKDVAKRVGVDAKTISNYYNNIEVVNKKTRQKIKKAIDELGYVPNILARGLRIGKSKIVGVLIPELDNPFYSPIIDGIEEVAGESGYSIILERNNYSVNKLLEDLEKISNYVDGIIICTNMVNDEDITKIIKRGIPIVALDAKIKNKMIPSIDTDNYKGAYEGVEYLINMGHKNIYFISEPLFLETTKDRWKAYIDCLKNYNIKLDKSKIIIDEGLKVKKAQIGKEIMDEILKNIEIPAAFFGTSDLIIIGAMKAALEKKISIPDDISFLGYDNIFWCEYTNPPLSTIKQPKKEMGKKSMKLLIDLMTGKKIKWKRICLETKLIERSTVVNLKNKNQ